MIYGVNEMGPVAQRLARLCNRVLLIQVPMGFSPREGEKFAHARRRRALAGLGLHVRSGIYYGLQHAAFFVDEIEKSFRDPDRPFEPGKDRF